MTSQYTADIEAIKIAQAKATIILQNVAKQQAETLTEIRTMMQCLSRHDREIVALETWRKGHQVNYVTLAENVCSLRKRINAVGTINALWAPVASVIAMIFGQQN